MFCAAFGVLGDPVRQRILELLLDEEQSSGEIVTVIRQEFGISQPAVSQHLRVPRENGFARVRTKETRRLYAIDGSSDTVSVSLTRSYDADVEEAWDALTDPERIPRWFYPISGELKAGGSFQLEGNAGGDIRQCKRPSLLQLTFGGPDSVVELRLAETDDRTMVELIHSVLLAMAGSGTGALFVRPGWNGALLGLGVRLRGESVGDPLEAANSPAVIEFNRGSVEGWTVPIW